MPDPQTSDMRPIR